MRDSYRFCTQSTVPCFAKRIEREKSDNRGWVRNTLPQSSEGSLNYSIIQWNAFLGDNSGAVQAENW